jgi:hypothetical protein
VGCLHLSRPAPGATVTNISQQELTTTQPIRTAGEICSSGAVIEVVSSMASGGLELALWKDRQLTMGPRIRVDDQCFVPCDVNPTIRNAMTFPRGGPIFTDPKKLLASLTETLEQCVGFSPDQSLIPAAWTVATWLPEFHYRLPDLGITGWDMDQAILLFRLFHCVVRHPLMLTAMDSSTFKALPMELRPTLLVNQPGMPSRTLELLQAVNYRDLVVPGSRGRVMTLATCKALYLGPHADHTGRLRVALPSPQNASARLTESECNRISEVFQPQLLGYRMEFVSQFYQNGGFAVAPLSGGASTSLGACVQDEEFVVRLAAALDDQEQESRAARGRKPEFALVEVLWPCMHDRREIKMKELTRFINTLIRTRGESYEYHDVEIGRLASNLGLPRVRNGSGMVLRFTTEIQQRLHQLSSEFGLGLAGVEGCRLCGERELERSVQTV